MATGLPDIDLNEILDAIRDIKWQSWGEASLYIIIGLLVASFVSASIAKVLSRHTSEHYTVLIRRVAYYGILALFILLALFALQLDVRLLGLASVLALGLVFASQTAVSNVISGLFLVFEKPFVIGNYLQVGDIFGEVLSIDLLSIKLRTTDNCLVRIPNESLLKSQFKNVTRFPIHRLDVPLFIGYQSDIGQVEKVLTEMANKHPMCLESPKPELLFNQFTETSMGITFTLWCTTEDFFDFKRLIPLEIHQTLRKAGIQMPQTLAKVQLLQPTS